MSSVQISYLQIPPDRKAPSEPSAIVGSEVITSSGVSQATTLEATKPGGQGIDSFRWRITNRGAEAIYVTFAETPTATSAGHLILPNTVRFFDAVLADKAALINA